MPTLLLINLSDVAQLMVTTSGLQEFSAIVTDSRLAELELKECLTILSRVNEECSAIIIGFSLDRVLIL
jgi:hypothetical protein